MTNTIKYYFFTAIFALFLTNEMYSNIHSDTIRLKSMQEDTAKCKLYNKVSEELRDFDTEIGLSYGKSGLELSTKLDFKPGIAGANKAIGLNYWRMGIYDASFEHFSKALEGFEELKDTFNIAKCYNNIGLIFLARNQYIKSEIYLRNSYSIHLSSNNTRELSRVTHNLGLIYFELKDSIKSLEYHKKSLEFARAVADSNLMAFNFCFIGKNLSHLKQFDSAWANLEMSMKIFTSLNNPNNIAMVYNMMADYYFQKNEYGKAIEKAQIGYSMGENIKNNYMKMESAKLIFESYKKLNDFKNALKFAVLHYELQDTMNNESNIQDIAYQEAQFEYNKKLKLNQAEGERQIQKSQLFAKIATTAAVLLLVIAIVVYFFNRLKNKTNSLLLLKNEEISQLNLKLQNMNSTKDKFFSIIAHDLKNPIGNFQLISSLLFDEYENFDENERKQYLLIIKDSSKHVYSLLENLLDWSRSQRGLIKFNPIPVDLYTIVTNCISLMTLSAEKKEIQIANYIQLNTIISLDVNLMTTVIRNLLSNAIKFSYLRGKIEIGISEKTTDNNKSIITIYVKDTGIGIAPETIDKLFQLDANIKYDGTSGEKGTGLGLILCKEFVEKHGGTIWVTSEFGKGSIFYFTLPL